MVMLHSTNFSESSAVQEPLAVDSTITGHSWMLNVTGMVTVVAERAVVVGTTLVLCIMGYLLDSGNHHGLWLRLPVARAGMGAGCLYRGHHAPPDGMASAKRHRWRAHAPDASQGCGRRCFWTQLRGLGPPANTRSWGYLSQVDSPFIENSTETPRAAAESLAWRRWDRERVKRCALGSTRHGQNSSACAPQDSAWRVRRSSASRAGRGAGPANGESQATHTAHSSCAVALWRAWHCPSD